MADRQRPQRRSKPHRYNSMVAAAEVITRTSVSTVKADAQMLEWQNRAWDFFDSVPELRFGVSWVGNAMSRLNIVAAQPPSDIGDEPTPIDAEDEEISSDLRRAAELVDYIAGGPSGQGPMLNAAGKILTISGLAWLIAEPNLEDPLADEYETWSVYSQRMVKIEERNGEKIVMVATGKSTQGAWRPVHPNALVVKCWRQHPDRWWEPDAPTRACLNILDQLDLLSAHITATGRSRLAGAGILVIPSEAVFPDPPASAAAEDGTVPDPFDYFIDNLVMAMTVPIKQRDNASAIVPLTVQVPGEFADKLIHLKFATPFDDKVVQLQEAAIDRLALGLDMPPEVLKGMSGVNHWTAWQVEDTAVTIHIEPNAEIVCQALTEGYLRPALEAEGLDPDLAIVWYDKTALTVPPDKSETAMQMWDRIMISNQALLRETGFQGDDSPDNNEVKIRLLMKLFENAPQAAPAILEALGLTDKGDLPTIEVPYAPKGPESLPEGEVSKDPIPEADRPKPEPVQGSAHYDAVLMACDGIVHRAMERAGTRLRNAIGKKAGGPQSVPVTDPSVLHCSYDPTLYADLDQLLEGAFDRVAEVASYLELDGEVLTASLNAYCRALLAAQHPHDRIRLMNALGADALG